MNEVTVQMKFWIYKTSDWPRAGCVREFGSLDECIKTLDEEYYEMDYIISPPLTYGRDYIPADVTKIVEIYDTYRE